MIDNATGDIFLTFQIFPQVVSFSGSHGTFQNAELPYSLATRIVRGNSKSRLVSTSESVGPNRASW